jgi:hypothetical protein
VDDQPYQKAEYDYADWAEPGQFAEPIDWCDSQHV